ncbi:MAG: hypothetical protein AAGA90_09420 [Actinomycetota bacterium]
MSETELLAEIGSLRAQADALPSNDFAGRYALESRIDALRAQLHEATADQLDAAGDEWAERAGRKGEHAQNVAAREAMTRSMPGEP